MINKRIAIIQSNYIPWKGYFDMIRAADVFVLYDDVQYTRRDWRNRNHIKTAHGLQWLTIPVQVKGKFNQRIDETLVKDGHWAAEHWKTIRYHYTGTAYFSEYAEAFADLYEQAAEKTHLSKINYLFLNNMCEILGITTPIFWSHQFDLPAERQERLVEICRALDANQYLSGPSAKSYLNDDYFAEQGISVSYSDYSNYPEYTQLYPPFEHYVSIIDLIFNEGPNASKFLMVL